MHVDGEECGGQNRAFRDSVGEISCEMTCR